jgi:hypothetical protein
MQLPEVLAGVDVARALKDEDYRRTLSADQQQALSALKDQIELSEEDLNEVAGGSSAGCSGGGITNNYQPGPTITR